MDTDKDKDNSSHKGKTIKSRLTTCTHSRLIDDIRDENGNRTGNVQCLECQAIFKDPA